jgi:hypothetical protein
MVRTEYCGCAYPGCLLCSEECRVLQSIQQDLAADSLKKADGFVGTAEQDQYDECEEAVMGVLSHVRRVARQWKVSNLVLFLPVVL